MGEYVNYVNELAKFNGQPIYFGLQYLSSTTAISRSSGDSRARARCVVVVSYVVVNDPMVFTINTQTSTAILTFTQEIVLLYQASNNIKESMSLFLILKFFKNRTHTSVNVWGV